MRTVTVILCFSALAAAAGDAFTNDLAYLKRKWRADVTDKGTGLDKDGVADGWQKIVDAHGDEPWEVTKAKIFAFGCDRTAIGVSPNDWFPAFAAWSFHRGHPIWKIMARRANEVDAMRSPGLAKKIAAGTKEGRWVVWKDYSHCAPDWDDIIKLGFPGMRDRLLANWKDAPYYHARRIAADATVRLVGHLADLARRTNESAPDPRIARCTQCGRFRQPFVCPLVGDRPFSLVGLMEKVSNNRTKVRQTTERKCVKLPNKSASNCRTALARLTGMIDTARMKEVAFRMVLTATGDYAYTRPDGVHVCPIGCLKP